MSETPTGASNCFMMGLSFCNMNSPGIAIKIDTIKKVGHPITDVRVPAKGPTHTLPTAEKAESKEY